jgi:ATP adenylyltransferase
VDTVQDEVEVERAGGRPGDPDGFQRLWAPHRMVYIGGQDKPATPGAADCPFCLLGRRPASEDRDSLVVHRDEVAYVVLNLYPYSPGHLLVCPYRHVADYTDLTQDETHAVARLTQQCMRVVREASAPHGFNLGLNQGAVAGAGIAAHLHQHVVPRWAGDANFLPVIGQTKALPQLLDQTWQVVTDAWQRLAGTLPEAVEGPRSGQRPGAAQETGQPLRGPSTSSGGVSQGSGGVVEGVPVAAGGEV